MVSYQIDPMRPHDGRHIARATPYHRTRELVGREQQRCITALEIFQRPRARRDVLPAIQPCGCLHPACRFNRHMRDHFATHSLSIVFCQNDIAHSNALPRVDPSDSSSGNRHVNGEVEGCMQHGSQPFTRRVGGQSSQLLSRSVVKACKAHAHGARSPPSTPQLRRRRWCSRSGCHVALVCDVCAPAQSN